MMKLLVDLRTTFLHQTNFLQSLEKLERRVMLRKEEEKKIEEELKQLAQSERKRKKRKKCLLKCKRGCWRINEKKHSFKKNVERNQFREKKGEEDLKYLAQFELKK
ncbi:hypothetical protein NPIL_534711 [Nephila pilipes]|uniref:Uncharacterized protein n=1 Tax=Nephila pilipes TaxID=299642 RepID=A0A8X6PN23_NEPPI|nr:hypothetical protein NPIL_534711 [Nephila pilipes]